MHSTRPTLQTPTGGRRDNSVLAQPCAPYDGTTETALFACLAAWTEDGAVQTSSFTRMGPPFARLPIYTRQHILSFLEPSERCHAAESTPRLSWGPKRHGNGCSFVSGLLGGRRRLRWGCWDKPEREWAFINAASHRYLAFMTAGEQEEWAIPRIIHTIWLGSPLQPHVEAMRESWKRHHPDWEHWLWTDADVEGRLPEGFTNREAFDAAQNYGEKSDILRYEVLYQFGGLYVDSDFECLAPMDDLHRGHEHAGLYAGLSSTGTIEVNNGLIGSRPHHPVLAAMIRDISKGMAARGKEAAARRCDASSSSAAGARAGSVAGLMSSFLGGAEAAALQAAMAKGEQDRAAMKTIERTGPGLFTKHLIRSMVDPPPADAEERIEDVLVLPVPWFYPIPNNVRQGDATALKVQHVRPRVTRAVHYWACSWQPK